jgi:hypothetical protein
MKNTANLLLVIISCTIMLAMIEVAVRLIPDSTSLAQASDRPNFYFPSDSKWTECFAGTLAKKAEDTFRIVVVGDSFTFPTKIRPEDSFVRRLEGNLQRFSNRKIEVIPCAKPGLNMKGMPWIVDTALKKGADLFLLQITLNDGEPRNLTLEDLEQHYKGKYTFKPLQINAESYPLLHHSKAFQLLMHRIHNRRINDSYIQYHKDLFLPRSAWKSYFRDLELVRNLASTKGVKMGALVFPMFSYPIDASYPFLDVHHKIDSGLQALGIPFLDLRAHYERRDMYRLTVEPGIDSHPNEVAHRIAADAIYDWIFNSNILSPEDFPEIVYRDYYREGRKFEYSQAAKGIFPTLEEFIEQEKNRQKDSDV